MTTIHTKLQFPEKAMPLFMPAPYKILHGGRGSAKSWSIARALLLLGRRKKLFIVCGREIQRSIKESVHKLLSDQIGALDLDYFYDIQEGQIVGQNGTRFVFEGIRNNIAAIKSYEGIDVFWGTEATFVPGTSWDVLLPTVRRDPPFGPFEQGSEIWIDFNPELVTDDTYQRFVVHPPEGAVVIEMNWRDNDWFPEILRKQKEEMRTKDHDNYLTVWEGKTRKTLQGAIYAKELATAIEDGRVGPHVKHVRSKPVIITFDLGRSDMTSLWFWQQHGMDHYAIDFYENCGYDFAHYLEEIQNRRYNVGGIWLPHDGTHEVIQAKKSIERQAKDAYPTKGVVRIVPRVSTASKINFTRQLFPRIHVNDATCAGGVMSLTHFQYQVKPDTKQRSKEPLHNWASHAANSFEYYAVNLIEGPAREKKQDTADPWSGGHEHGRQGWMQ